MEPEEIARHIYQQSPSGNESGLRIELERQRRIFEMEVRKREIEAQMRQRTMEEQQEKWQMAQLGMSQQQLGNELAVRWNQLGARFPISEPRPKFRSTMQEVNLGFMQLFAQIMLKAEAKMSKVLHEVEQKLQAPLSDMFPTDGDSGEGSPVFNLLRAHFTEFKNNHLR